MRNPKSLMPLTNYLSIGGLDLGENQVCIISCALTEMNINNNMLICFCIPKNCFPMVGRKSNAMASGMSSITSNRFVWVGKIWGKILGAPPLWKFVGEIKAWWIGGSMGHSTIV